MARIMRDSTVLSDIPAQGADIVAVYINGKYAVNPADLFTRFPRTPHLYIDVLGTMPEKADVLDVENGDVSPGAAPDWAMRNIIARYQRGLTTYPPLVYANRANMGLVVGHMHGAGMLLARHYMLWIATLDGTRVLPDMAGVAAVQYAGETQTGGHYDQSVVYDNFLFPAVRNGILVHIPSGSVGHVQSTDGGLTFHAG